jgi:hypothetical protein
MICRLTFDENLCWIYRDVWIMKLHRPKNKADFRKYKGGSPLEGKFTGDSLKLGIISSDYWEISPPGDFLPNTLGNLLCFRDSVGPFGDNNSC